MNSLRLGLLCLHRSNNQSINRLEVSPVGRGDDDGRLFHGGGLTFDLERDEAAEEEGEIHERTHESDVKSATPALKRKGGKEG